LLAGRDFEDGDRETSAPVVIINEAMAEWLWPNQPAIGKRLRLGGAAMSPAPPWMTVVGVVANIKRYSLTETPKPEMLVPYTQDPYPTFNPMQFVVRSRLDAAALTPSLRGAIASVDPTVPLAEVRTIDDLVLESSANVRSLTLLTIGFAAAALVLAVVGTFGVMGYAVQLRRRELGVRRALGAGSAEIVGLVLGQVGRVTLVGIIAGLVLSAVGGWLIRSLLFGVQPFDPVSAICAACAIAIAAAAASAPALVTAARVEPRVALEE
jgi:ABC-type antimicrobial peptide transport system permease subunit